MASISSSAAQQTPPSSDLRVQVITQAHDFPQAAQVCINAFGHQVHDGVYMAMNPGWDTPAGVAASSDRMATRWRRTTTDHQGRPNTVFLKATIADPEQNNKTNNNNDSNSDNQEEPGRITIGLAIWMQASAVPGHGEPHSHPADLGTALGLDALYPGNETEQRYLAQCMASLHARRAEAIRQTAMARPPAVFVLDLCAVDPAFQGRGAAKMLVQWGLDEARRRGGLECILEGSSMGRHVYSKLGFRQEGPEIEYVVDEEFWDRVRPSNVFMRTGIA